MKANTTQLVKIALLSGKKLTVREMDKKYSTNNSCEIIRRLRENEELPITLEWKRNKKTGKRFGVYSIPKSKKVSKIKTLYV